MPVFACRQTPCNGELNLPPDRGVPRDGEERCRVVVFILPFYHVAVAVDEPMTCIAVADGKFGVHGPQEQQEQQACLRLSERE